MSASQEQKAKEDDQQRNPISVRFQLARKAVVEFSSSSSSSSPHAAVNQLETLQEDIAALALFSRNETIEDLGTKALPLLSVEYYLAVALMGLPSSPSEISERKRHVRRAMDLWSSFLQTLEQLEMLSSREQNEYHILLEVEEGVSSSQMSQKQMRRAPSRDDKIARFQAKQQQTQELERLQALQDRRKRLGMSAEEMCDNLDEEALERSIALQHLQLCKTETFEHWESAMRELPMIEMMIQAEEQRQQTQRHRGEAATETTGPQKQQQHHQRPLAHSHGLQVTNITTNAVTGQLEFRRQEIKAQVFRPGWNQPTMTLAELGDIERSKAIEREEKQKLAEEAQTKEPQKYEQLVRKGLEDDARLVDASAALDRAWDGWKDENPRGSGNKRGDVGDRNF